MAVGNCLPKISSGIAPQSAALTHLGGIAGCQFISIPPDSCSSALHNHTVDTTLTVITVFSQWYAHFRSVAHPPLQASSHYAI